MSYLYKMNKLAFNLSYGYQEIEKDGFNIDRKVEMLISGDTPSSVSHACSKVIVRSNGTPETKPIDNVMSIFFFIYGLIEVSSILIISKLIANN